MENQRTFLLIALLAISVVLYQKWLDFSAPPALVASNSSESVVNGSLLNDRADTIPTIEPVVDTTGAVPSAPQAQTLNLDVPQAFEQTNSDSSITVNTDLAVITINRKGGVIERLELKAQPVSLDEPDNGFPLLKNTPAEIFVAQDGLIVPGQIAPNHLNTTFGATANSYDLGQSESVKVPLTWQSDEGVSYTKTFTFHRDSYVIDIDYRVGNNSASDWQGYLYAQFSRTEPADNGGGFGRLPSFTGGAVYTPTDKYKKIDFDEIRDGDFMNDNDYTRTTQSGWVAVLQHYFVAAWMPDNTQAKEFYTSATPNQTLPQHRIGYKTTSPIGIPAGASANLGTRVYIGTKEQSRLKQVADQQGVEGLALTVDYGWLTFIADPLFTGLSWIHSIVGNWGWSIIILTILIKIAFYPLSAASFRSMAGMKKLQPRIQTLKERYKEDKQKFQMEMMALYKKEKINPAGGCLPILIQIPVFIALYWALLESVEMRHAPFALWLQDLSAKDPYYILPVLMGLSMWAQQKLNPAPMDEIQKKVMAIMPIALTFLFLTFPQGLVLYWVVNNVLSMAQQWFIYRQIEKKS